MYGKYLSQKHFSELPIHLNEWLLLTNYISYSTCYGTFLKGVPDAQATAIIQKTARAQFMWWFGTNSEETP